jgi:hypothetical protein
MRPLRSDYVAGLSMYSLRAAACPCVAMRLALVWEHSVRQVESQLISTGTANGLASRPIE